MTNEGLDRLEKREREASPALIAQALALRAALEAFVLAYENPGGAYDVSDAYEAAVKVLGELGK